MRGARVSAVAAVAAGALLLAGCGILVPPSTSDIAGSYAADGASVRLDSDGSCAVSDYPGEITADDRGRAVFGPDRFDASCKWEVGRLLYSGEWELNVRLDSHGTDLFLAWNGVAGCLQYPLGDPDLADRWQLCPADEE